MPSPKGAKGSASQYLKATPTNLDVSARMFLERIDAVDEITPIHHIFLATHPDDQHKCPSELIPDIAQAAVTNTTPITATSKSGTVRAIAEEYRTLIESASSKWPERSSWIMWKSFIRARSRLLRHFFRIPLLVLSLIISIYLYQSQILLNCSSNPHIAYFVNIIVQLYFLYNALSQLHFLATHDTPFRRAFLGHKSKVSAGLYYNPSDAKMMNILSKMPHLQDICPKPPCGWANGDIETLLAVVLNEDCTHHKPPYIRRWVKCHDGEGFSFDLAFPTDPQTQNFYHNSNLPVIILNHGLNGDSNNSFIRAHVAHYISRGHTVAAITARGFGNDGIIIRNAWNGARHEDLQRLIKTMHIGCGNNTIPNLHALTRRNRFSMKEGSLITEPQLCNFDTAFNNNEAPMNIVKFALAAGTLVTPICAIGFSMSGILVSKYCTRHGENTGLAAAVAVCAMADRMRFGYNPHSEYTWEPMLCDTARGIMGRHQHSFYTQYDQISGQKLSPNIALASDSRFIREVDTFYTCYVAGYGTLEGYYSQGLSFAMDYGLDNLKTPLFTIFPENDPIINVDGLYPAVQLLTPYKYRDAEFNEIAHDYTQQPIDTDATSETNGHATNLSIFVPPYGGHISSFRRWDDKWGYLAELTLEYFVAATGCVNIPAVVKLPPPIPSPHSPSSQDISLFDTQDEQGSVLTAHLAASAAATSPSKQQHPQPASPRPSRFNTDQDDDVQQIRIRKQSKGRKR